MISAVKNFIFYIFTLHYVLVYCFINYITYCCIALFCCKLFKCHSTTKLESIHFIRIVPTYFSRRDSIVGIAAGYGLDGLGIESQWD
jgi:hypothetical protein